MDSTRFTAWYNKLFKWISVFTSAMAIMCLFMRRYYKNMWINTFIIEKFDKTMTNGPLFHEYNEIIMGSRDEEGEG